MNANFEKLNEMTQKVTENMTKLTEMNMNFFNSMYTQTKNLTDVCSKAKTPEDFAKANMDYVKQCQESFKGYNKESLAFLEQCQADFHDYSNSATKGHKKAA